MQPQSHELDLAQLSLDDVPLRLGLQRRPGGHPRCSPETIRLLTKSCGRLLAPDSCQSSMIANQRGESRSPHQTYGSSGTATTILPGLPSNGEQFRLDYGLKFLPSTPGIDSLASGMNVSLSGNRLSTQDLRTTDYIERRTLSRQRFRSCGSIRGEEQAAMTRSGNGVGTVPRDDASPHSSQSGRSLRV
jgi:hypothetical protein